MEPLRGRWQREATDIELSRFLKATGNGMVEWPEMGICFVGHKQRLIIARCGILGGDVRDVHGGWVYANQIAFLLDWTEIAYAGKLIRGYE